VSSKDVLLKRCAKEIFLFLARPVTEARVLTLFA
jgi:hypothetical protein